MKKYRVILFLFMLLSSSAMSIGYGRNSATNSILVLGPKSKLINDLQERLLRETVMRSLQNKGLDVVPVMKMEQFIQKQGIQAIGKTGKHYLKQYCNQFNARYTITGSIAGDGKKSRTVISPSKLYICRITLYDKKNDIFHNISFDMKGKENLYLSFSQLADLIAESVKDKISM